MNEQNKKLDVIKNRCETSIKVIKVLQIIGIIGVVASLTGAILCFALKDTINQTVAEAIASGNFTVENFKLGSGLLNFKIKYDEAYQSGNYAAPLTINCLIAVVITSASIYFMSIFKKIFANLIKEDNPFSDSIMSGLKKCFIVIAVLLVLFEGIGPGVIGGLLLWCIYSIFEYGRVLQIEVDETL